MSAVENLQAEIATLRESNAWYRARNLELLRLLSGREVGPSGFSQEENREKTETGNSAPRFDLGSTPVPMDRKIA